MKTATRKILKVGSSGAVTIPAKDMKSMGLTFGDELEISYKSVNKPTDHEVEVVAMTQKLIKRHKQALKNLNQR